MKKMLITGGTVFASRFAAEYFRDRYQVFVLNRNTRPQCRGVTLIQGDRHTLSDQLRRHHFDVVLDVTAYNGQDVNSLLDALGSFGTYILISSSAVYPETTPQPFAETAPVGANIHWGAYGLGKIEAEEALKGRVTDAYILRPPYLYGPGNNVYREAFVFDCAREDKPFYLPGDGSMKLQFLHIEDLYRFVDALLEARPRERVFNVGNPEPVSILRWVALCYAAAGKKPDYVCVDKGIEQRAYFPFYDYEYVLDVSRQGQWMPRTKPLEEGLREAFSWYTGHEEEVRKKPLLDYIHRNLEGSL